MDPTHPATSSPPPEGALCAEHPHRLASATCERCGLFLCDECCRLRPEGGRYCAACASRVEAFVVPWELRSHSRQGLLSAWWQTVRDISFSPDRTLRGVGRGAAAQALGFGVLTYTAGMLCYLPFSMGMQLLDPTLDSEGRVFLGIFTVVLLVTLPLWSLLGFFIGAAFYHPFLRIVGGQGDFNATLRAVCYGVAPMLFYVVPCFGWLVGGALTVVTSVYAQKHAHRISGWHVVGSWLLASVVVTVILVVIGAAAFFLLQGTDAFG